MKTLPITFFKITFSSLLLSVCLANAQTTCFTYQGRFNDGSSAAHGSYERLDVLENIICNQKSN